MLERYALTLELIHLSWYSMLASGLNQKLERWNDTITARDSHGLAWEKTNAGAWAPALVWLNNQGWSSRAKFVVTHRESRFYIELNKSRHVGVFPEQAIHWAWARAQLTRFKLKQRVHALVLFGYTNAWVNELGGGVRITHVDTNFSVIQKAKANAALTERGVTRSVNADAFEFLKECVKNGTKFNAIMADPPALGWVNAKRCDITTKLTELITLIDAVSDQHASLVCLNLYSSKYNEFSAHELVKRIVTNITTIDSGNVVIRECANVTLGARVLSSRFVRWTKCQT